MMQQTLLIKAKTEQLLYRIYPRLVKFPKSEKFSLCARIKEGFFELLKFIQLGSSVKSKRKVYLQEADGHLQIIKTLIKLSYQRKYINDNFYEDIDLQLTEINKMLSGFIKSC